jgi:hypothetical protein
MTRKEFLKLGTSGAALGLATLLAARCKSSTTPGPTATSNTFTSSTVQGHNHTVTVAQNEINSPPSGGISRETSSSAVSYGTGHTHTFTMTQTQLTSVMNGTTVTIETSATDGGSGSHTHVFSIAKWF